MNTIRPLLLAAVLLSATVAQAAPAPLLPLAAGTYVRDGVDATDAPFAAVLNYDGQTFSGAHSSGCTTNVLSHRGAYYRLETTCTATGDGTAATPYREIEHVVILSPTSLQFAHHGDSASYRLTPTGGV